MPVPYDDEVRRSVLAAIEQGMSYSQAAAHLRVSRRWIGTIVRRYRGTGSVAAQPNARTPILGSREEQLLAEWLSAEPSLTLARLASKLGGVGVSVSLFTVARALKRLGWRRTRLGWKAPFAAHTTTMYHAAAS
jgi:transposase